jgi:hypothetical protein
MNEPTGRLMISLAKAAGAAQSDAIIIIVAIMAAVLFRVQGIRMLVIVASFMG